MLTKTLLLIPALLLAAPASFAGQLMPNLYAAEYCSLRDLGVNKDEARRAAVSAAYVASLPSLPTVTIDGETYGADTVRAFRETKDRCPQHL